MKLFICLPKNGADTTKTEGEALIETIDSSSNTKEKVAIQQTRFQANNHAVDAIGVFHDGSGEASIFDKVSRL